MTISAGVRLGPYEIVSLIGAGGMGEVYKARDTRLDRIVAIKVLPAHLSDRPDLRERFEREARTISSLNHPHICTLYDIGRAEISSHLKSILPLLLKNRKSQIADRRTTRFRAARVSKRRRSMWVANRRIANRRSQPRQSWSGAARRQERS